ncbi:MAG: tetratricopeptide repeat protein [Reichenbachiella sp.]|uniref:tetratricopeptide repeat protein n=1 Tax=Reichenbachiella sp. TaxID=2184521 RepID=UPI00326312E3
MFCSILSWLAPLYGQAVTDQNLSESESFCEVRIDSLKTRYERSVEKDQLKALEDLIEALYVYDPQEAVFYGKNVQSKISEKAHPESAAQIMFYTGRAYGFMGHYDSLYLQASLLYEFAGHKKSTLATAHGNWLEGEYYIYKRQYQAAMLATKKALDLYRITEEKAQVGLSLSNIGWLQTILNGNNKELAIHSKILSECEISNSPLCVSTSLRRIGMYYLRQHDYEQALEYLNQSLIISEGVCDRFGMAKLMKDLGLTYSRLDDYSTALDFCQKALVEFENLNNLREVGMMNLRIGNNYKNSGKYKTALLYYNRTRAIREQLADKTALAAIYLNIGVIHRKLGDNDKALSLYMLALEIYEDLGNKEDRRMMLAKALVLNNIGVILRMSGNHEEAVVFFYRALSIREKFGDKSARAYSLSDIGVSYERNKNYKEALLYYNQAYELRLEIGHKRGIALSLANIANAFTNLNEYEKAKAYYFKSLSIRKEIGDLEGLVETWLNIGNLNRLQSNYQEAQDYADSALVMADSVGALSLIRLIQQERTLIYESQGHFDSALYAHRAYKNAHDSLFTSEGEGVIAELQQQYQTKEQKQQITILERDQQIQQLWVYGLISVVGLLIVVAVLIYYLLSNRAKVKSKLIAQERQLEQAKNDIFLNIAHELRTPLTLIRGPLSELEDSISLTDLQQRSFRRIRKNSEKLVNISEEILQVSKMELEKMEVNPVALPYQRAIDRIYSSFEALAETKKIHYVLDQQIEPDFYLYIDKQKFEKILEVLLSNALKYSREGDTVTLISQEENGQLRLTVQDTGIGIDKKDQPHIFKRYYQSKKVSKLNLGGVGIGLSLAHEMALVLEGDIRVKSDLGQETQFILTLPKTMAAGVPIYEELSGEAPPAKRTKKTKVLLKDRSASKNRTKSHKQKVKTTTVLIVEDDPDMLEYIEEILSEAYAVLTVPNGKRALELLKTKSDEIDLVVSDVMMPEMDGLELLKRIKSDAQLSIIPVILLTAMSQDQQRVKALSIGVSDYLSKPFKSNVLLRHCQRVLSSVETRKAHRRSTTDPGKDQILLDRISLELNKDLTNPTIDIKTLADQLNEDHQTLITLIKQATGHTPESYFQEFKMQHARRQIETHNYDTIRELSAQLGYINVDEFIQAFEARYGEVPDKFVV